MVGLTIEMDLPEMGAVGTAIITDIKPCPPIKSAGSSPDAQVVTATFKHPPTTTVLDVTFTGDELSPYSSSISQEATSLGVTGCNLWYETRLAYCSAGI